MRVFSWQILFSEFIVALPADQLVNLFLSLLDEISITFYHQPEELVHSSPSLISGLNC